MLDEQEWFSGLLPRPEGIRFARGMLFGITLCLPIWVLILGAVASRF
jgi:hypothetical protein